RLPGRKRPVTLWDGSPLTVAGAAAAWSKSLTAFPIHSLSRDHRSGPLNDCIYGLVNAAVALDASRKCRAAPGRWPRGRLKPVGLVHEVAQRLAFREGPAVVQQNLVAPLVEVGAVAGDVRRQQNIAQLPQRMVARQRLLFVHVERRAGDLAGLQGCGQI